MIYRLTPLLIKGAAFNREEPTIKNLAERNGINLDIEKMVKRRLVFKELDQLTSLPRQTTERDTHKRIRLPYLRGFTTGLSKILKTANLTPAYYKARTSDIASTTKRIRSTSSKNKAFIN